MPAKKPKLATRHRRPCDLLNRRAVSVRGVVTTDKPHWAFHRATRPACRDRRPRTSVDDFIRKLQTRRKRPRADKRTLLRRAT